MLYNEKYWQYKEKTKKQINHRVGIVNMRTFAQRVGDWIFRGVMTGQKRIANGPMRAHLKLTL